MTSRMTNGVRCGKITFLRSEEWMDNRWRYRAGQGKRYGDLPDNIIDDLALFGMAVCVMFAVIGILSVF
jgi:hypothetical protein